VRNFNGLARKPLCYRYPRSECLAIRVPSGFGLKSATITWVSLTFGSRGLSCIMSGSPTTPANSQAIDTSAPEAFLGSRVDQYTFEAVIIWMAGVVRRMRSLGALRAHTCRDERRRQETMNCASPDLNLKDELPPRSLMSTTNVNS
jgi:hypothetical protein